MGLQPLIANRSLLSLPPDSILSVLQQLLKRSHYSCVDAVIYQSDHFVSGPDDDRDHVVWATAMRPAERVNEDETAGLII
jgi:hypothetical protein